MNLNAQVEINFKQEQLVKDFIKAVDDVKEAITRFENAFAALGKIEFGLKYEAEPKTVTINVDGESIYSAIRDL